MPKITIDDQGHGQILTLEPAEVINYAQDTLQLLKNEAADPNERRLYQKYQATLDSPKLSIDQQLPTAFDILEIANVYPKEE